MKKLKPTTKQYNEFEVALMNEAGYLTPRQAVEATGISLWSVYRAAKNGTVRIKRPPGKTTERNYNLYVNKDDVVKLVKEKMERQPIYSLDIDGGGRR